MIGSGLGMLCPVRKSFKEALKLLIRALGKCGAGNGGHVTRALNAWPERPIKHHRQQNFLHDGVTESLALIASLDKQLLMSRCPVVRSFQGRVDEPLIPVEVSACFSPQVDHPFVFRRMFRRR